MDRLNTGPQALLRRLEADYNAAGFQTGWTEATAEGPFRTFLVLFDGIGEEQRSMQLELCFLPGMEEAEAAGICILQSFVTLAEKVSSASFGELLRLAGRVNTTLPLGAFGLFEDTGDVYFKHNTLLQLSNGDVANAKTIDAQNGLILHLHQLYMEAFLQVAGGRASADEAIALLRM